VTVPVIKTELHTCNQSRYLHSHFGSFMSTSPSLVPDSQCYLLSLDLTKDFIGVIEVVELLCLTYGCLSCASHEVKMAILAAIKIDVQLKTGNRTCYRCWS
jgi:hypothetical protein